MKKGNEGGGEHPVFVFYRLPDKRILIVNETDEWKKAARERKTLYINTGMNPEDDDYHYPPEHIEELRIRDYLTAEEDGASLYRR